MNKSETMTWLIRRIAAAVNYERSGDTPIDGDHLDIDYTPVNYTPSTAAAEADNVNDLAAHLQGIDDELAQTSDSHGGIYVTSSAETSIATVSTPVKMAGTTALFTSSGAVDFDTGASHVNGDLRYTGAEDRCLTVIVGLSLLAETNNRVFNFYIALNGTVLADSKARRKQSVADDVGRGAVAVCVDVVQNDLLSVWVENISNDSNVTMVLMTMTARG